VSNVAARRIKNGSAKKGAANGVAVAREDLDRLVNAAARIREQAYAPYSRFKVGAAVLSKTGHVYSGCNVENSSYGLSLCAERSAIAAAVAAGDGRIVAAAVVTGAEVPAPPCGMCLQTLSEFGGANAQVVLMTLRGQRQQYGLGQLMPHAFDSSFL
jgi:cytidine deaminase